MKPLLRNLLALSIVVGVALTWIGMTRDGDASTATLTKGTQWALDCKSQLDMYAASFHDGPDAYVTIENTCDNVGAKIDNGAPAPDIASMLAAATTTTLPWGAPFTH